MHATQHTPTVTVLGMGGTIAMTRTGTGGVKPALSAGELLSSISGLSEMDVNIEVADVRRIPGASLTFADMRDLDHAIKKAFIAGADAAVVTQGTDTIEETSYLLDVWHQGPQPIVITGAMRNPAQAGHDGPANLLAAVRTAASPMARGRGVMVVMADEIHAAGRVCKTHATSPGAFTSPGYGPIGQLTEACPQFFDLPLQRLTIPLPRSDSQPRVALVTAGLGDQGELLDGLSAGFDGLVVAAMGAGHVPAPLVPKLQQISNRIPVIFTTRTGAGSTLTETYAFPGSEQDLLERGLIPGGFLHPLKARILLLATLAAGISREDLMTVFAAAGSYTRPAISLSHSQPE
jgi:L-asparaginase